MHSITTHLRQTIVLGMLIPAFLMVAGASFGDTADDVQRLKLQYEQKFQQYNQALQDGKAQLAAGLAKDVQAAKAAYDESKRRLTIITDKVEANVNKVGTKIGTAVKKLETVLLGEHANPDRQGPPLATGQMSLGYANLPGGINGNNYCGQYAMSTVLNGLGLSIMPQKVYDESNPGGIFTAPSTAVEYLSAHRVPAAIKNNASLDDIKAKLDAGLPVMVLEDSNGTPHWIVVTGYQADASGRIAKLEIWSNGSKYSELRDAETFLARWANPLGKSSYAKLAGYHNLMIDVRKPTDKATVPLYSSNFGTATEDNIAGAINDTVTGWKNKKPFQLAGGLVKGVTGLSGAVIGLGGSGLTMGGEKLSTWGQTQWASGSLGGKVMGGTAVVAGTLARGLGTGARFVGNVLSSGATLMGNALKKLGGGLGL